MPHESNDRKDVVSPWWWSEGARTPDFRFCLGSSGPEDWNAANVPRVAAMTTLSQQVHQIADQLSSEATWDDVRYQVELRASIERGLADVKAGRVVPVEELLAEYGVLE